MKNLQLQEISGQTYPNAIKKIISTFNLKPLAEDWNRQRTDNDDELEYIFTTSSREEPFLSVFVLGSSISHSQWIRRLESNRISPNQELFILLSVEEEKITSTEEVVSPEITFVRPLGSEGSKTNTVKFTANVEDLSGFDREFFDKLVYSEDSSGEKLKEYISDLKSAFSIERIENQFYQEFGDIFYKDLCESIEVPDDVDKEEYAQLTVNRVLFIMFVQQKGWLTHNDVENPKSYLEEMYDKYNSLNVNYYEEFFHTLFFRGMARKQTELTAEEKSTVGNVPYLNCGLFEPKQIEDQKSPNIKIENSFFDKLFSDEKNPKTGKNKGLLRRYPVTLDEDSSDSETLAVDPEFIGKIFEMVMNAQERSEKGAFYTPKSVTQYMTKNAILQFLTNEGYKKETSLSVVQKNLKDDSSSLRDCLDEETLEEIHYKLKDIDIVDPAVGSGAFVVEMVNELASISSSINNTVDLGESFEEYKFKRDLIVDCIYGVDIDSQGVEFTKFRLWLNMIEDLNINQEELRGNWNRFALPNLDFNVYQGNSLVGEIKPRSAFEEGQSTLNDVDLIDVFKNISSLQRKYAKEQDRENQKEIKRQLESETDKVKSFVDTPDFVDDYNEFIWCTSMPEVLGNGDGFDVVIGNPPYEGNGNIEYLKKLSKVLEERFNSYERIPGMKFDLYQQFIYRGYSLTKENGVLSYITSDTFKTIGSKISTRNLLLENTQVNQIIESNNSIFDATVEPIIFTVTPTQQEVSNHRLSYIDANSLNPSSYSTDLLDIDSSFNSYLIGNYKVEKAVIDKSDYSMWNIPQGVYQNSVRKSFFKPSKRNMVLYDKFIPNIQNYYKNHREVILDPNSKEKKQSLLKQKDTDCIPLGLISVGGAGLQTPKNQDYLAYKNGTKKARELKEKNENFEFVQLNKNTVGRSRLGKVIKDEHIANIDSLTKEEKLNGISSDNTRRVWVPIIKGKGEQFYKDINQYINWSKSSVSEIKDEGVMRNNKYNFNEGLFISRGGSGEPVVRYAPKSVFDSSGGLYVPISEKYSAKYLNAVINSDVVQEIIDTFINHTVNTQLSDMRLVPIVYMNDQVTTKIEGEVTDIIRDIERNNTQDQSKLQEINSIVENIYLYS